MSAALRTLEERSRLLADLAADARRAVREEEGQRLDEQSNESRDHARTIRELLLEGIRPQAA